MGERENEAPTVAERLRGTPAAGEPWLKRFLSEAADRIEAAEAERDALRTAMIAAGRHAGAALADTVSTDFLLLVPEEARLKIEGLTADRDRLARELEEAREALRFYASGSEFGPDSDANAWISGLNSAGLGCRFPSDSLQQDQGRIARAALASGEAP